MKKPKTKFHSDNTLYARGYGYAGRKRVIVSDGKVISHGNVCWFDFCASLRRLQKLAQSQ
jgi:hypothetical protein